MNEVRARRSPRRATLEASLADGPRGRDLDAPALMLDRDVREPCAPFAVLEEAHRDQPDSDQASGLTPERRAV